GNEVVSRKVRGLRGGSNVEGLKKHTYTGRAVMKALHTTLAWSALAMSLGVGHAQQVQAAGVGRVSFSIQAKTMEEALTEFGTQSGWQILFSSTLTEGKRAPVVRGALSAGEALSKLLAGSSLSFERINSKTVAIRET